MTEIQIYSLTDEQRVEAKEDAKRLVRAKLGIRPTLENFQDEMPALPDRRDYADRTISEYPQWLIKNIGRIMAIVFIAAALPSLFRLFSVGKAYFLQPESFHFAKWQAGMVGISTFLLAEFLVVLSTIAMRVLFKSNVARIAFVIPIAMGLAMALVGNWTVVQPHDAFSYLETFIPPLAVLFVAIIGENIILHSVKNRYENERAYQQDYQRIERERIQQERSEKREYKQALSSWKDAYTNPEASDYWISTYANALKDKLKEVNDSGRGKTERMEYLASLSRDAWIQLVRKEILADQWFDEQVLHAEQRLSQKQDDEPVEVQTVNPMQPVPMFSMNGNGKH